MLPEEKKTSVHRCLKEGKRKVSTPPSIVKEKMPLSNTQGFITSMQVRVRVIEAYEWVAGRLPGF